MNSNILTMSQQFEKLAVLAAEKGDKEKAVTLFERAALYATTDKEKLRLLELAILANT